jgi:hypothetical protein
MLHALGQALFRANRFKEAVEVQKAALELKPGDNQGLVVSVASASPDPLRGRCRSRTSQLSRRQLRSFSSVFTT